MSNSLLHYQTARLNVAELSTTDAAQQKQVIQAAQRILTPAVVAELPPSFAQITTPQSAQHWLATLLNESQLLVVRSADSLKNHLANELANELESELANEFESELANELESDLNSRNIIGFIFISNATENAKSNANDSTQPLTPQHSAHLGYLLAETHWRQGFAVEMLQGLLTALSIKQPAPSTPPSLSIHQLLAGVAHSNRASQQLLLKLGFNEVRSNTAPPEVIFYQYELAND